MKPTMSYPQFLKAVAGYSIAELEDFIKDIVKSFELFPEYASHARRYSGTYITVYPLKKYVYADDNLGRLVGTSASSIRANGIGQNEKLYYQPDDTIHDEKIFVHNLEFFRNIPVEQHPAHLMSCNFRVLDKKGELQNMMQESCFIRSAPDGMPLVSLGFITDISHIRNDNRIGHAIRNQSGEIYRNHYYSNRDPEKLSNRQIEILRLVFEGLTTKEIAQRLHVSEKTADNHKQNIRMLTNSRNVAEMINYAIRYGYLDV